jgi:tetratricopeptide (TPR) repeat protein
MSDGWRARVARFAVRRAAACQRHAPGRADWWLSVGAAWAPTFGESHTALVHLRRARDDRFGAVEAARAAAGRFPDNPDAWMLLGDACQMAFRQADALGAFEEALALEERADAALAAGELYRRAGRHREAAARFARAYAAGAGADALMQNARELHQAGDHGAADEALKLWATLVPNGLDRLPQVRAELRG